MAKHYIDREALIEWLKRIPLKDLSDGLGLCRVIMEDDFKKAIKKMPKGIIGDAVPVVRCRDCKHYEIHKPKVLENCERNGYLIPMKPYDFCSYGERKDDDGNG